jgi:DNA-binding MarR family transcriptional regulator
VIEKRWQERFGKDAIENLRASLRDLTNRFVLEIPGCLPILGYGLFSKQLDQEKPAPAAGDRMSENTLPWLLSKVLLAFALEFEGASEVSLAISANVLRLVGHEGIRIRDLPRLAGVSKEGIAMSLNFLAKRAYAVVKPESPGSRVKVLVLTPKGRRAQDAYHRLVWGIEERWQESFGEDRVQNLRHSLELLVGASSPQLSPLFPGLEPYPNGWRAKMPRPGGLPHYPMILHRGGYPDGS